VNKDLQCLACSDPRCSVHNVFCENQPVEGRIEVLEIIARRYFDGRKEDRKHQQNLWAQIRGLHALIDKLGCDYGKLSGKHQVLKSRHRNVMRLLEREYPEVFAVVQQRIDR
jgi:hypothetical protein